MSNNLALGQLTMQTADKDTFINGLFDLIDSSITSNIAVDGSVSTAISLDTIRNYLKISATGVPAGGSTLSLPPVAHMFILHNDKGSAGTVVFACGSASIAVQAGFSCIAYMDGTANGLEVVSSAGGGAGGAAGAAGAPGPKGDKGDKGDPGPAGPAGGAGAAGTAGTAGTSGGTSGGTSTSSGGLQGVGKHKHWRIGNFTAFRTGGNWNMSGMELHAVAGGPSIEPTSIAASATYGAGYETTKLRDNNPNTQWASQNTGNDPNAWLTAHFDTATALAEIVLTGTNDDYYGYAPSSFVLSYSDDGVTFFPVCEVQGVPYTGPAAAQTFSLPAQVPSGGGTGRAATAHVYWRCRVIASNNADYMSAFEVQFRETAGVSLPMGWGPGSGYATHCRGGAFSPQYIFDGDPTSRYAIDNTANLPIVWGWSFPTPRVITEYAYLRANGETPGHFIIECSDDGDNWTTVLEVNGYADATYHQDSATFDVWALPAIATS